MAQLRSNCVHSLGQLLFRNPSVMKPARLPVSATQIRTSSSPAKPNETHDKINDLITNSNEHYKEGDIIHGYKLEKIDYIKELNIKPFYLRHETTGAEHLHIQKHGDSNNVFSVTLRTTPKNSRGVAHILEHLALCGSKRYAIRDPFFKMRTRSLATFMNAMTGPDFTAYPFSTQNEKDFENLLSVYLDAVFFPRLRPVDFRQEGWRLEHDKPDKKDTPIILRGVVYNEMKGVFSSSSNIYSRHLLNQLFPDTTYRYESGGDPEDIPDLTHKELKKFHQVHYHPSNAKFFTYGDMPMDRHLELINELVMKKFSEDSQAREQSIVTQQEPWIEPKNVDIKCPIDPLSSSKEKQTTTSISYMLPTTNTDYDEMLSLQLLSALLMDGPNAPFHKSLIESGIGSDYSPSSGFANYTKQPYFSIGLENIKREDIPNVHDIIEKTFKETAEKGFPQERIDAILHSIELSLKHVRGNFGLRLFMNLEPAWNHEGDVIDYLRVNKYVERFKKSLKSDKDFWRKLITRHFLSNKHKLILNMNPDESFEDRRKERENSLLERKISELSDVDKQTVLYEGMELMKIQNSKDDPSILPCLEPSKDISEELSYRTNLKFDTHKGVSIQLCEQPTNEVVYFRALSDFGDRLNRDGLIDYLPLFCDVVTKLGAGSYNRFDFDQKVQLTTGGLGVSVLLNPSLDELDKFKNEIMIGSHCLRRNVANMFELWGQVFKQIHFQENKEYLSQLVKACAAGLADGISHNGQTYATKRSAASLSNISALDERLSGLTLVAKMKDIEAKESIESIASKLQNIALIVLNPLNMRCAINAEADSIDSVNDELKKFVEKTQESYASGSCSQSNFSEENYERTRVEDIKFPFSTHFVAKSLVTVPKLHRDFPKLVIMSKLISSKYLLREVREKGGAYGSGAYVSTSGILNFFSYRDPNTDKTMKIFDKSAEWIGNGSEYNEKDIEESKLGVFQDIDRPVEPGKRGLSFFMNGESDDIRQEFRRRLLEVSRDDVQALAKKYLDAEKTGTHII